jgi:hypothetical protein
MNMTRRIAIASAVAVMGGGVLVPATASAAPAEPMHQAGFSTCKQLRAEYSAGIAKNKRAARKIVKRGYKNPLVCKRVYVQVRAKLDRNRNGVACETR